MLVGSETPLQGGTSLIADEHIDPASAPAQLADMENSDKTDVPEGAVPFNITAEEIAAAIAAESPEVEPSQASQKHCCKA